MSGRRAVFLDRDGTINVDNGYVIERDKFELLPGVPEALKRLQDAGFLLVVVTNQSGIGRGFFSLETVDALHEHMRELLREYGVELNGIYLCPHGPNEGCECRKPKPGMLLQAAKDLGIDLEQSYMVGDQLSDVQAGIRAGCCPLLIHNHGPFYGLGEAVDFLFALDKEKKCTQD